MEYKQLEVVKCKMTISERVKNRRLALSLTQTQLAEAIGVTQNAIHKIEDGTTKQPRNISELAQALKCSPNWLLFGEDIKSNEQKMDLAQRVKLRRTALGLTQKETAEASGMIQQSLQKIEDGKTQNPRRLVDLARVLKCSPEWLLFGRDGKPSDIPNISAGPEIKGFFPLISWVRAGTWSAIEEIHALEAERFPCPVSCSANTFVLKVQGISMEPTFRDGDLIFVDPEVEWRHGAYVVARLNDQNEATFKQLVIEGSHKFLKPLNPNWPEQLIPINGNCEIVGVVIFSGRAF
ncbi:helix-turn-helix domain-containing protein [Shewanella xiamenensis]|uniref:helix-turn-helix domain-containing protein n=1 Tax=Shewanella xiamenensis TaxID=332186 RepID=UPI00313AC702